MSGSEGEGKSESEGSSGSEGEGVSEGEWGGENCSEDLRGGSLRNVMALPNVRQENTPLVL